MSESSPRGKVRDMSARVKAVLGVVAVDLPLASTASPESSRGQAKVALFKTISPAVSDNSARGTSADDMYFSIRRHETKPDPQRLRKGNIGDGAHPAKPR
jgi:hypothetical protein